MADRIGGGSSREALTPTLSRFEARERELIARLAEIPSPMLWNGRAKGPLRSNGRVRVRRDGKGEGR
jgi:hypothetical protein